MLRHPINRAVSHYGHSRRRGYEDLPIDAAFDAEDNRLAGAQATIAAGGLSPVHQQKSYKSRSMYAAQVERYLKLFGRDQLFLATTEALLTNPGKVVAELFAFVGVEPYDNIDFAKKNVGDKKTVATNDPDFEAACRADTRRLDAITGRNFYQEWFGD